MKAQKVKASMQNVHFFIVNMELLVLDALMLRAVSFTFNLSDNIFKVVNISVFNPCQLLE